MSDLNNNILKGLLSVFSLERIISDVNSSVPDPMIWKV